jgi:selenide,water dikinase
LLFDPQTSGGLIATVRPEEAQSLVQALKDLGYAQTTIVGTIVEREKSEFAPLVYLE